MTQKSEETVELLVLDPRRQGWAEMVAASGPGTAVLVLDARRDGLNEMLEVLRDRAPFQRIRIADAGSPGRLWLGSLLLDMPAMATRESDLAELGRGIAPGGALLLCGGGGGSSAAGGRFVAALARLLARDVAAAQDWTPGGIGTVAGMPAAYVASGARTIAGSARPA